MTSRIPNLKVKSANAYGPRCYGCVATQSDVMVSFGDPTPYGGDNSPTGPEEPGQVVDVFMDRDAAVALRDDLNRVLSVDPTKSTCTGS